MVSFLRFIGKGRKKKFLPFLRYGARAEEVEAMVSLAKLLVVAR